MNCQGENPTGQDSSKELDLFGKLSLSKSTDDHHDTVKDSKGNESTSSSQSNELVTPSTESSDQVNLSPVGDKVLKKPFKTRFEKLKADYSRIVWNGFAFDTPFPNDPIIDGMILNDLKLDKSFSTDTRSLTVPKRLGYFSSHVNPDGKTQSYRPDKSSARYLFYHPCQELSMDLLEGFSEVLNYGRVPPSEMHLLRWFSENRNSFDLMDDNGNSTVDFICYNKRLRRIMETIYDDLDDWIVVAIKVRGSIIIDEIYSPYEQAFTKKQTSHQRASAYSGYKLKELITRRYDGIKNPTHVNTDRDSFYIVSKAKLNKHTILYASRIDCALNNGQLPDNVDEIKAAQIRTKSGSFKPYLYREAFWRRKALSWWIDSWLVDIDLIICGSKDEDYYIEKIDRMWVNRLPYERNGWSPRTCVSFLDLVLSFIKTMVTDELTPYRFYCAFGKVIVCQKINEPVEKYLPPWFINNQKPDDD